MKRLLAYLFIVLGLGLTFNVSADAITGKGLCINGLTKGAVIPYVVKLKNIKEKISLYPYSYFNQCPNKEFLSKKKYPFQYKELKKMVGIFTDSKKIPLNKILYIV